MTEHVHHARPTAPVPLPMTGGCQCGARRYRIVRAPLTLYSCHCLECRRQSASAFGTSLIVPAEALEIDLDGLGDFRRPTAGGRMSCRFCPDCGVRLLHERASRPDVASVKGGTLDALEALVPAGHIWASRAVRLCTQPHELVFPGQPPGFEPLHARFAALNRFA